MPEQSKTLGLDVESRLKMNLTELCLSASAQKSLYDYCLMISGDPRSQPIVNLKDLPAKPRNALIEAIIKVRDNMAPSVQPGTAVSGENFRQGIHTLFGYDPAVIPKEAVMYINMDGGAGLGVRFKTDSLKYEFGIHFKSPSGSSR